MYNVLIQSQNGNMFLEMYENNYMNLESTRGK